MLRVCSGGKQDPQSRAGLMACLQDGRLCRGRWLRRAFSALKEAAAEGVESE